MAEYVPFPESEPELRVAEIWLDYMAAYTLAEYSRAKSVSDARAFHDLIDVALVARATVESGGRIEVEYSGNGREYQLPEDDNVVARFKSGPKSVDVLMVERLYSAITERALKEGRRVDHIVIDLIDLARLLFIHHQKGGVLFTVAPDGDRVELAFNRPL